MGFIGYSSIFFLKLLSFRLLNTEFYLNSWVLSNCSFIAFNYTSIVVFVVVDEAVKLSATLKNSKNIGSTYLLSSFSKHCFPSSDCFASSDCFPSSSSDCFASSDCFPSSDCFASSRYFMPSILLITLSNIIKTFIGASLTNKCGED